MKSVSIVVITYNEEKNISGCLSSLLNIDYPKNKYEILVIDASTDKTFDIASKFKNVKVIKSKEKGFAVQRNLGIKLSKNEFILFNRYNWWNEKTTSLTQVCYGIAYNHHTGLVPPNSQYSNQRCMGAETFSTDIFSLGFLSISQSEEDAYKERVKGIMRVDNIDRRVIFDTLMIAGLHYKNISTYRGDECENWEAKYIAKTACKYHGKCYYNWAGRSGDYCQETCDYYNQLTTGEKADCNNVSSRYFVDNGNDGFCTFK